MYLFGRKKLPNLPGIHLRGFTLVEMLVVISIVGLISTIIIFQYSKFDSQLLLHDAAFEIALEIREAQVLAVSVQSGAGSLGGPNAFEHAYGVHFDIANPYQYILFRDDKDGGTGNKYRYDSQSGNSDTILNTFNFQRGMYIEKVCVVNAGGASAGICTNAGSGGADVSFVRPNPDALILKSSGGPTQYSRIEIWIKNNRSAADRWKVKVYPTGQIQVMQ